METIFFDTNIYYDFINLYNKNNTEDNIQIDDFCKKIISLEERKGCQHAAHEIVVKEILRQFTIDKKAKHAIDVMRILHQLSKSKHKIIFPFEVELACCLPKEHQKTEYLHASTAVTLYLQEIISNVSAKDPNTDTNRDIISSIIANGTDELKKETCAFSIKAKEDARQLNRKELEDEFVRDFMDCIRYAIADNVVDDLSNHLDSVPFKPAIELLKQKSQDSFSSLRNAQSNYDVCCHQHPNIFIDALILASACIPPKGEIRAVVTNDKAILAQKKHINTATTEILSFHEYLEFIDYPMEGIIN